MLEEVVESGFEESVDGDDGLAMLFFCVLIFEFQPTARVDVIDQ